MEVVFMVVSGWVKGGEGVRGEGVGLVPTVWAFLFFYLLFFLFLLFLLVFISNTSGNEMNYIIYFINILYLFFFPTMIEPKPTLHPSPFTNPSPFTLHPSPFI
jgi:hypothetical protein